MNQIRRIVQAKIDNIIQLSEIAGEIKHNPTIGELRESYLIDFFKELVPNSISLTSGFITDAEGRISPQLDLIVTKKSALPLIEMKDGLSIVPIESVLLVAEIKSDLTTADLKQVEKQNEKITTMELTGEKGSENFIVPTIILAYDSSVNEETLISWMRDNGNTVSCCTLKKNTLVRDKDIVVFKNIDFDIKHHGVLTFVSTFHKMLEYLNSQRDYKPNLDVYLTGRPK
ncbi:DUF6602 domain-containing protein [Vibrio cholerae]|uniref:DUF6602 domain-containing protein n=1 Tax=Vibrio cholerae TaxID=666 RepID=UPI0006E537D6|nr:DUF6602 domain-containing protein [Vibrio cholerae]KQA39334.1 hypothetical protein XV75_18535 [Vibrio cholerae]KQA51694.1 hypothetical protein XV79_18380 [Vibrio cholerae]KQA69257.1 hypothetical protein XV84_18350 [Vibrio cholerae]KQA74121.1 hypothetical protein XV85_18300 [Vibrio cholerae]PAR64655.1 hypothetical protein CGT89_18805 [Vibrio cholerae]